MKALTPAVNLDDEVQAITKFIALKWTQIENLEDLVRAVRDAAVTAARAWYKSYELGGIAFDLMGKRQGALEALNLPPTEELLARHYDSVCLYLRHLATTDSDLQQTAMDLEGHWDYTSFVKKLTTKVMAQHPDLRNARPLGWDILAENYCDFDGQEEYEPWPDMDLFEGSRVESNGSPHFTYRTALPYVMYDEKCQSLKAYQVLVGAIAAHFLGITEYLNSLTLKKTLHDWFEQQPAQIIFEGLKAPNHPVLRTAFSFMDKSGSEQAFREHVASRNAFYALSAEEQAAIKSANASAIMSRLSKPLAGEYDSAEVSAREQARANELKQLRKVMKMEFGA